MVLGLVAAIAHVHARPLESHTEQRRQLSGSSNEAKLARKEHRRERRGDSNEPRTDLEQVANAAAWRTAADDAGNATALRRLSTSTAPDDRCDATVSYLFLAPTNELPLSSAWMAYFAGCPAGSYTVHVHAQQVRGAGVFGLSQAALVAEPVTGELRFSYRMQSAMNKLYEAAAAATAPNGCQPRWAQMLSDSCAPVASCTEAHEGLAKVRGVSQFEGYSIHQQKPKKSPAGWGPSVDGEGKGYRWWFQSQWGALWMDHARLILAHEAANRPAWEAVTRWPVDSHYVINILYSLGAQFSAERGTTAVAWRLPRTLTVDQAREEALGHPILFDCNGADESVALMREAGEEADGPALDGADGARAGPSARVLLAQLPTQVGASANDARAMLSQAVACGRFFARKFAPSCAQLLTEWQQSPLLRQESVAKLGDDTAIPCNQAKLAP